MSRTARTLIEADGVFTPVLDVHGGHTVDVSIDITGTLLEDKDVGNGTVVLQRRDKGAAGTDWVNIAVWDEGSLSPNGEAALNVGIIETSFYSAIGYEYRLGCLSTVGTGWDSGDIIVRLVEGASYGG